MAIKQRDYVHDHNFLVSHLKKHLLGHLIDKKILKKYKAEFMQDNPDAPKGAAEFHSLAAHVAKHLLNDFYDFFLFSTDARRVQPVFRDIVNFHQNGFEALPDHMLHAGNFDWVEGHTIELSLIVRGIGKSVYLMCRAVWNLARFISDKSLILHGKQDLSTGNISLLKSLIISKALSLVFPRIFKASLPEYKQQGGILRREMLDLKPNAFLFDDMDSDKLGMLKKESTYVAASLNTDETGSHYARVYFDDLVNKVTSRDKGATTDLIEYFQALSGLEEYDSEREFEFEGVGTEWWADSLYDAIREMGSSVFSLPIEYQYKEKQYYIAPIFNAEKVAKKVTALGVWANSQLYMKSRPIESAILSLGFDPMKHVLNLTSNDVDSLKRVMLNVQTCDPAYSEKGKKEGDKKSRFTILYTLMTQDTMYIYDVYMSLGERTAPTIKLNTDGAIEHKIDFYIMDAQGTQESLYKDVRDSIWREYDATITCIPYKKGSNFSGMSSKTDIANGVLQSLVLEDKLKVLITDENKERMQVVIDQLMGKDAGLDVIDCIVYTKVSPNVALELPQAMGRKSLYGDVQSCFRNKIQNRKSIFR